MKPAEPLTTLLSHNLWANLRLLERCAELTDEQLDATLLGTFGYIRDTLQHIVLAEQNYFSRIRTGQESIAGRCPTPDNRGNDRNVAHVGRRPD
jgi:uncharacterized damage-inducible protein DinB